MSSCLESADVWAIESLERVASRLQACTVPAELKRTTRLG